MFVAPERPSTERATRLIRKSPKEETEVLSVKKNVERGGSRVASTSVVKREPKN
jgi:hypothetical protein